MIVKKTDRGNLLLKGCSEMELNLFVAKILMYN